MHNDSFFDGNAAAGELREIFSTDLTAASGQCAACGNVAALAQARVYAFEPGIVIRCARCEHALMRIAKGSGRTLESNSGATAAIDVHDLAGNERRRLEKQHGADDISHFPETSERDELFQAFVTRRRMHRRSGGARRHGVHPNTACGKLDRQPLGSGIEATLGKRGENRGLLRAGLIRDACGDVDDVPRALLQHRRDCGLRYVKEAGKVRCKHGREVGFSIFGKRFGDKYPGIVHQRIDAAKPSKPFVNDLRGGFRLRNVAGDRQDSRIA
jgi:hypothetical protein